MYFSDILYTTMYRRIKGGLSLEKIKSSNIIYVTMFIFFVSIMAIFISIKFYNEQLTEAIDSQVEETLGKNCDYANNNMKLSLQHISEDLSYISNCMTNNGNEPSVQLLNELLSNYSGTIPLTNTHYISASSLATLTDNDKLTSYEKKILDKFRSGESISFIQDDNNTSFTVAVPLYKEGNISGLLYSTFPIDYFKKHILSSSGIGGIKSYVVTQDLTLLTPMSNYYTLDQALEGYTFPEGITTNTIKKDFEQGKSKSTSLFIDQQKYYMHYSPCEINNWYLISICQEEKAISQISILSSASRSLYNTVIVVIAILLFLVLAVQCFINIRNGKNYNRLLLEKACYETAFELTNGVLWEYDIINDVLTKSDPDQGIMTPLAITEHYSDYMRDSDIIYPDDTMVVRDFFEKIKEGSRCITVEIRAKDITGTYKWFEITSTTIKDNNDRPILVIGQSINIDAEKRTLEQIKAAREMDSLTKLYNKETAQEKIAGLIAQESESKIHALLILDIDNFKEVNSTYGYVFGDALLVELATRLSKHFKIDDNILSRIGGDSFLVYLTDISSASDAINKGKQLLSILQETFNKQDESSHISGSVGLALYPVDGSSVETLLNKAKIALAYSKDHGSNHVNLYNSAFMTYVDYSEVMDEIRTRNSYQPTNQSIIDSSLITNAVEILFDARDIESSINMILGIIGSYYDFYYIAVVEKSEDDANDSCTYKWRMENNPDMDVDFEILPSTMQTVDLYNIENNNIYYCSNLADLRQRSPSLTELLKKYSINGFLVCGISNNGQSLGYIVFTYKDKERIWNEAEVDSISLISKILGGYIFNLRAQARADRLQRTDPLTNANNLTAFTEYANRLIHSNPSTNYVLFYSDINKFKLFNDTYGYTEGDRLLIEFANALKSIMDYDECFGRVNADKFVGLFNYNNPKHFLGKIRVLHDIMNQIPKTKNENYRVSIIIGLCPIYDNLNLSVLIDRANIARKSITNRHKSRYSFFNEAMKSDLVKQKEIEDLMEISLSNDDFLVFMQPKVYLRNKEICGAEALVRWQHPTKGMISPNDFIPIFEENQFIIKLDYFVFEQTCKHIRKMLDAKQKVYPVSVNMSRLHLGNNDVLTKLKDIVDKYQVPTHYLEIELTESALQENSGHMFSILFQLHKMGFIISMDDFGSGLSSLNLLRTLPFDELKLDKDFFQQGTSTERERIVITNIVRMAQDLNMTIVSEGVETEEQADFLSSINCDIAQGYLFARPMPMEEYEKIYYPNIK